MSDEKSAEAPNLDAPSGVHAHRLVLQVLDKLLVEILGVLAEVRTAGVRARPTQWYPPYDSAGADGAQLP